MGIYMSSNLFLTKDLEEAFKLSENKQNVTQQNTATHQGNVLDSVTSDVFMSQLDATDMNQLVNMLTSEQNTQQGGSIVDNLTSENIFADSMSFNLTQTAGGNPTSVTETEQLKINYVNY